LGAARRGPCAIDEHLPLWVEVRQRWHRGWSPEEIAGRLKRDHPDLPLIHTFQESIYRYVYIIARGERQKDWTDQFTDGRCSLCKPAKPSKKI